MNVFEKIFYDGTTEEIKTVCEFLEMPFQESFDRKKFYTLEEAVHSLYEKYSTGE